jgi:hypothetical protein
MANDVDRSAEILRRVSNFLRSLTEAQIDDLIEGRVKITLTGHPSRAQSAKARSSSEEDVERIISELTGKSTRAEGIALLDNLGLTRASLRDIALAMKLPVPKTDTVSELKDRIVEATIGYRLRSDAIREPD